MTVPKDAQGLWQYLHTVRTLAGADLRGAHLGGFDFGLRDITADVPGRILIGRRDRLDTETRLRRARIAKDHNIRIHTYDYLLETCLRPPIERTPLLRSR